MNTIGFNFSNLRSEPGMLTASLLLVGGNGKPYIYRVYHYHQPKAGWQTSLPAVFTSLPVTKRVVAK